MYTIKQEQATGFIKYLPNIASIIRLAGSFLLFPLIHHARDIGRFRDVPWIWLIVYIVLVLTDSIDGTLARKLNAKSNIGASLDALGDTVLLVIAAGTVFVVFAHDSLTEFQSWFYICLLIFCAVNKLSMNLFSKIFFGTPNMLHSYPQKAFALGCYIFVGIWAFLRNVPWWSLVILISLSIYGSVDEIIYCARAAKYDVDFKGHGFQKYELKKKDKNRQ